LRFTCSIFANLSTKQLGLIEQDRVAREGAMGRDEGGT
jgi:hypothetical protein